MRYNQGEFGRYGYQVIMMAPREAMKKKGPMGENQASLSSERPWRELKRVETAQSEARRPESDLTEPT